MKRRDFLKLAASLGAMSAAPAIAASYPEPRTLYNGTILLTIHTGGGWDHSSFSDPRENSTVNHWADTQSAGQAGNLRYAPMGENAEFFNKYYQDMLVINGIDIQTNGHSAATRHRNTGNLMAGFPSLNELYASVVATGIPTPYLRQGGYSGTVGLMPFTTLPDETMIRTLSNPNYSYDGRIVYQSSHMEKLRQYQAERLYQLKNQTTNTDRWQQKLDELHAARGATENLKLLGELLPESLDSVDLKGEERRDVRGLHLFLVMAAAGMTATGSFSIGGWDSHNDHDNRHTNTLINLTRSLDYVWTKAETMGLADRLMIHVTSDVGRRPFYNANDGKDHWSVGSDVIMAKNAPWGNRIVGASGPEHKKMAINPSTLQVSESGVYLQPKHIHAELRKLLGIQDHANAQRYNLNAETLALFDSSVSTGITV